MPIQGFVDNFSTTLNGSINNSVTSIVVTSAAGISAELALSDFIALTIDDGTNIEIVHVTGVSSNTLTVVRAQEGSTAQTFATAVKIECRATRGAFKNVDIWQPKKLIITSGSQATVEFTGLPDGDYRVDFCHVGSSAGDDMCFVQGTSTGPSYQTSNYYYSGMQFTYSAQDSGNRAPNAAQVTIAPTMASSSNLHGHMEVSDLGNASSKKTFTYLSVSASQARYVTGGGVRDTAEAVTALKYFFLSGATFVDGSKFLLSRRNH